MENQTAVKVELDEKLVKHVKSLETMSARIKYLDSQKMARGDISRFLTEVTGQKVIYQWVRNVLITPVKKSK